ncbi:MAG: SDR family oxidoreductase [Candidatus Margulisbacteria bacterium]|nr:SDR family oxidoreductase [Candidatus Margulisiibacteriota bacterium]
MKSVLIIGSEGALGSALAVFFQSQNWHVIGFDYHDKSRHAIAYHAVDFSDSDAVKNSVDWLSAHTLTCMISTIAQFGSDNTTTFNWEEFHQKLHVNIINLSLFCVAISRVYATEQKPLKIVLVGSAAAHVGSLDIAYGISKAGLNGLVISLSKCFASKGISVVGVNPGIFESDMSTSVPSSRQEVAVQATHIKRKGRLDEIVSVVTFAAVDSPDYLTGSILQINGGQYSG